MLVRSEIRKHLPLKRHFALHSWIPRAGGMQCPRDPQEEAPGAVSRQRK